MNTPPWSYSSLTAFETCPKQYHVMRVLKAVPFQETEATRHGTEVHKALELRLKDNTPLPDKYAEYEPIAAKLDKPGVFTEQQIALTRNLQPCDWWDKKAWCRGIIDVGIKAKSTVLLADYKTGKMKPDSSQLELFAAMKMAEDPTVETAKTMFIWLKEGKTTVATFTRADTPAIWEGFMHRVQRLENAYEQDKWTPKPSGLCAKWCPVGKKHCSFCGSK